MISLFNKKKDSDRIAEYEMKLMDIDADTLGIPDTDYDACVTMASSEFSRIVRDLSQLGESVRIEISKEGVRFASDGEAANGSVLLKQTDAAREKYANYGKEDAEKEEEGEGDESKVKVKTEDKVKKEEDVEMDQEEDAVETKAESDAENENDKEYEDGEEEVPSKRKRKKPATVPFFFIISPGQLTISNTVNVERQTGQKSKEVKGRR
jgi:proliferating cell nuclear antigen